jgi:hypothetical protein
MTKIRMGTGTINPTRKRVRRQQGTHPESECYDASKCVQSL